MEVMADLMNKTGPMADAHLAGRQEANPLSVPAEAAVPLREREGMSLVDLFSEDVLTPDL